MYHVTVHPNFHAESGSLLNSKVKYYPSQGETIKSFVGDIFLGVAPNTAASIYLSNMGTPFAVAYHGEVCD